MDVIENLRTTLDEARGKLDQAEAVAALIPKLRREIRVLERTLASLEDGAGERRPRTGPSLREQIVEAVASAGVLEFEPGHMLPTVVDLVDGKKKSIQVELHRLIREGDLTAGRDSTNRPVSLTVARAANVRPIDSVRAETPAVADTELLEG